jgi:hypothetical protein
VQYDAVNERYFLRGFTFDDIHRSSHRQFLDVVPLIRELIGNTYDMYLMPEIVQPLERIGKQGTILCPVKLFHFNIICVMETIEIVPQFAHYL